MSQQNGPSWYPSKQFPHNPSPPPGAKPESPQAPGVTSKRKKPTAFRRFVNKFTSKGRSDTSFN
jgi:hypothetical protein